jgi:hypothetical protein
MKRIVIGLLCFLGSMLALAFALGRETAPDVHAQAFVADDIVANSTIKLTPLADGPLVRNTTAGGLLSYAGSAPAACTAGQAVVQPALSAAGALTFTCAPFGGAGSVGGTGTAGTVSKFTAASTIANSSITENGSGLDTCTAGLLIGNPTTPGPPSLQVQADATVGNHTSFEVDRYSTGSNAGTDIRLKFGFGSIATPLATPLASGTTSLGLIRMYGYDTANAEAEAARFGSYVDQSPAAGTVPAGIYFMNTTSTAGGSGGVGLVRRRFGMDSSGHFRTYPSSGALVPAVTACGTGATLVGTDFSGQLVEGTLATGCVLTFGESYALTSPACTATCTVTGEAGLAFSYVVAATGVTITNIGALSSTKLDYTCSCVAVVGVP